MKQKLWLSLITCLAYCIDKELYKAVDYLREQVRVLVEHQEKEKREQKTKLVEQGKIHLKNRKYKSAIDCFEAAFQLDPDKDIFVFLAYIYKGRQRKDLLRSLIDRWHQIERRKIAAQKRSQRN